MRSKLIFLTVIAIVFVLIAGAAMASDIYWYTNLANAQAAAKQANKPMMFAFYSGASSDCVRSEITTFTDPQVAAFAQKFVCLRIDADRQPDVSKNYNITNYPSTVFLKSDGTVIATYSTYMKPGQLYPCMTKAYVECSPAYVNYHNYHKYNDNYNPNEWWHE